MQLNHSDVWNISRLVAPFAATVVLIFSWMAFPYLVKGTELLADIGQNARESRARSIAELQTRVLARGPNLEITATRATASFFQFADSLATSSVFRPDLHHVFFVTETTHIGKLPDELPTATLRLGEVSVAPVNISGPELADHHRVTAFEFPKTQSADRSSSGDSAMTAKLTVSGKYLSSTRDLTFLAQWPLDDRPAADAAIGSVLPMSALAGLAAGLLASVLTPCLFQLSIIFVSVLAAQPVQTTNGADSREVRVGSSRVLKASVFFVLGFVLLYTVAGAVVGAAGYRAQLMFSEWAKEISLGAGALVIGSGLVLMVPWKDQPNCRTAHPSVLSRLARGRHTWATTLLSVSFALGCTACFGGAIVGTLIVHVGLLGSAGIGATIMALFSIGIAVPFLLAASQYARSVAISEFVSRHHRKFRLIGSAVIIVFGLVLVTDNFHQLSDLLYPLLMPR